MSDTLTYQQMGATARSQAHVLFAQTMGYVTVTQCRLLLRYRGTRDARTDLRHSGTTRTRSYGVDASDMSFQRHGWDIHIVSAGGWGAPMGRRSARPRRLKGGPVMQVF